MSIKAYLDSFFSVNMINMTKYFFKEFCRFELLYVRFKPTHVQITNVLELMEHHEQVRHL
jgi:hypothetical protein